MAGLPSSVIDRAEKIVQQCQEARMFDTNTDVSTFLEIVRVLHTNNDANLKSLLENI
jgi:DNA mismatch repair ATPase MutS